MDAWGKQWKSGTSWNSLEQSWSTVQNSWEERGITVDWEYATKVYNSLSEYKQDYSSFKSRLLYLMREDFYKPVTFDPFGLRLNIALVVIGSICLPIDIFWVIVKFLG